MPNQSAGEAGIFPTRNISCCMLKGCVVFSEAAETSSLECIWQILQMLQTGRRVCRFFSHEHLYRHWLL